MSLAPSGKVTCPCCGLMLQQRNLKGHLQTAMHRARSKSGELTARGWMRVSTSYLQKFKTAGIPHVEADTLYGPGKTCDLWVPQWVYQVLRNRGLGAGLQRRVGYFTLVYLGRHPEICAELDSRIRLRDPEVASRIVAIRGCEAVRQLMMNSTEGSP